MKPRIEYVDGELDEIVTDGGAHLERMDEDTWFLEMFRFDGTCVAVLIDGKIVKVEERPE